MASKHNTNASKKVAPKKKTGATSKSAAARTPARRAPTPSAKVAASTKAELFPEGEEGIDLVLIAKSPKKVHVQAIALSPSSRHVVAGDLEKGCRIIDVESGDVRALSRAKEQVAQIGFLDDDTAIIGDAKGLIRVVDLHTGAEQVGVPAGGGSRMTALCVASGVVAYGRVSGPISLWRPGSAPTDIAGKRGHLVGIAMNEQLLCTSYFGDDDGPTVTVTVFDPRTGEELRSLTTKAGGSVSNIVIVGGHVVAATTGGDGKPEILSWKGDALVARATLPENGQVDSLSVLDDKTVACAQFHTLTHVDVTNGTTRASTTEPWVVASAQPGGMAVVAPHDGNVGVYDLKARALLLQRACAPVRYAALGADRITIATCDDRGDITVYRAHPIQ